MFKTFRFFFFCFLIFNFPIFASEISDPLKQFDYESPNNFIKQLNETLNNSPLSNTFNLNAQNYLGLDSDVANLEDGQLPRIEIPTPTYAAILAASAASHFAKAYKGFTIDWSEVEKGNTIIKTLIWQLKHKKDSFMLIGGQLGGSTTSGDLGVTLSDELKSKLDDLLKKAEDLLKNKDASNFNDSLSEIISSLDDFKKGIDQQIADSLQNKPENFSENQVALTEDTFSNGQECGWWSMGQCSYEPQDVLEDANQSGGTLEAVCANTSSPLDPVVVYSGEFLIEATDLKVKGIGLDFELKRFYRNQSEKPASLGFNWTHNFEEKLILNSETKDILWQNPDGRRYWYKKNNLSNSYLSPRGFFTQLKKEDKGYVIEHADKTSHYFDEKGYLIKISDAFNNQLKFEYGLVLSQLKLVRVIDTLDRRFEYRYSPDGLLIEVKDPFSRIIQYDHDKHQNLVSIKTPSSEEFPQGKITRYSYSGGMLDASLNHNLTMIMDPKGQIYLKNIFGVKGANKDKLIKQRFGDKDLNEMTVSYEDLKNSTLGINQPKNKTIITDRNGNTHEYIHNFNGLKLAYKINTHNEEKWEYNNDQLLTRHIFPNGKQELFFYNERNLNPFSKKNLIEHQILGTKNEKIITRFIYDSQTNNLLSKQLIAGSDVRQENYAYDKNNLLILIDNNSFKTQFGYNLLGQLTEKKEGDKTTTFTYQSEKLVTISDSHESQTRSTQISHDKYGNINQVIDGQGFKTTYWYNSNNLLVKKRDALNNQTYFKYDENNNLIETTFDNKGGFNVADIGYQLFERYTYDYLDNLVKKETQINREKWSTENFKYDANENLIEKTGMDHIKRSYVYDDKNQIIEEKIANQIVRTIKYDENGEMIEEQDALKRTKNYKRDGLSRIVHYTDSLNNQIKIAYTGFGQIQAYQVFDGSNSENKKSPLIKEMIFAYDSLGRKISESQKNAGSVDNKKWFRKYIYKDRNLSHIEDNLGLVQKFSYNGFGQISKITDANLNETSFTYDNKGQIISKSFGNQDQLTTEKYEYDSLGRAILKIDAKGNVVSKTYDSLGNVVQITDALNQKTQFYYDGLGRIQKEIKSDRNRKFIWNDNNQLISLVDANNQEMHFSYDEFGRLKTKTDFDKIVTENNYDLASNLISQKIGDSFLKFTYNNLNQLIKRESQNYVQSYQYDSLGRLKESIDFNNPDDKTDDIKTGFTYNGLGHLIQENVVITDQEFITKKQFDLRGRKTAIVYPSGQEIKLVYDQKNNVSEISANNEVLNNYFYASNGLVNKEILGNGIIRQNSFDSLMNLTSETYSKDNTDYVATNYFYDSKNRVLLKENKIEKKWMAFNYNDLDQLAKVGEYHFGDQKIKDLNWNQVWSQSQNKREYIFDMEGQLKSILNSDNKSEKTISIASSVGYQYKSFGDDVLDYDNTGNLIGYGEKLFEYDAWNRLVRVKEKSSGKLIASYAYDAFNRRIIKSLPHYHQTIFSYDNWNLIEETTNGNLSRSYYNGQKINEPLAFKTNNQKFYYHRDRLGSITQISDEYGRVIERYVYDEYGNYKKLGALQINENKNIKKPKINDEEKSQDLPEIATIDNPITYTGQYFDAETGLYYFKNRYYASKMGRFISKDPLGLIDGPNVYAYVNNDPINFIDPMGTFLLPIVVSPEAIGYNPKTGITNPNDAIGGQSASDCKNYWEQSVDQLFLGNYTDDVTVLGTGMQIGTGLLGIDAPGDIRDLVYDFDNWEWSLSHIGQTTLDGIGLIPVIGAIKYVDEFGALIKNVKPFDLTPTHKITKNRKQFKKFVEEIRIDGRVKVPVKYVEYNGKKYIVDGHHRTQAAKILGIDEIPAQQVELPYKGYKTIRDFFEGF